jgi:hypothetical protein
MQKIISLYQRDYSTRLVIDEVVLSAEWVLRGEGVATRKYDGTCCLVEDGKLWKRYEVAARRTPPPGFQAADEVDVVTGKQQGWVPVADGPEDRWHREALSGAPWLTNGTYELVGPKVNGNPEHFQRHVLVLHGAVILASAPRSFEALRDYLAERDYEGIVWHHGPDGAMVKIKGRDFGIRRGER